MLIGGVSDELSSGTLLLCGKGYKAVAKPYHEIGETRFLWNLSVVLFRSQFPIVK